MAQRPKTMAVDGQGVKPTTPKPAPTIISTRTGGGQKPATPKPMASERPRDK